MPIKNKLHWNIADYITLCKPKVVLVMLITSWVGMRLAAHATLAWQTFMLTTIGIGLTSSAAAVMNHLIDRRIDARMVRTANRPMPNKRIPEKHAALFALILSICGLCTLSIWVNLLTATLTFLTFVGYAVLYSIVLKPRTPQNIVIGGAAGAMPPLLGWTAVTNQVDAFAWLLVLIIFAWTPPHFWALAIYRKEDYVKANIPMLPITHGIAFTKLYMLLYTILLFVITILPYVAGMSGFFYLISTMTLNALFLGQMLIFYRSNSPKIARRTFTGSIIYLLLLFGALLIDHYV